MSLLRDGAAGLIRRLETLPEDVVQGVLDLLAETAAGTTWGGRLLGLGLLLALASLPAWAGHELLVAAIAALWLAYTGQAWNLLSGFAGPLSLGQSLFVGLGAWLGAELCVQAGIGPWPGLLLILPVVALVGAGLGALALRTGMPAAAFALLTVITAEACRIGLDHFQTLGGATGPVLPASAAWPDLQHQPTLAYYLILALALFGLVLARLLLRSRLGYRWQAVRADPVVAAAAGVPVFRTRLSAVMISAMLTAPAGVFLALYAGTLAPDQLFSLSQSMEILLSAVLGGLGTLFGPVLGAFLLVPLDQLLAWFGHRLGHDPVGLKPACYGLVLVLVVMIRPGGLWPWLARSLALVPPPPGLRQDQRPHARQGGRP